MKARLFFLAVLFGFLFASCASREDKAKCVFVGCDVVEDEFFTSEYISDADGGYTSYDYFIVIHGDTIEYTGRTYPGERRRLEAGDSVWIFKDWGGRHFYSAQPDRTKAIDAYANPKIFTIWKVLQAFVILIGILAAILAGCAIVVWLDGKWYGAVLGFIVGFAVLYGLGKLGDFLEMLI